MPTMVDPTVVPDQAAGRGGRGWTSGRWPSTLALAGGVLLAVAGIWAYHDSTRAGPAAALRFASPDQELGPIAQGELRKVAIRVTNPDRSRPARILGVEQHCNAQGCLFWRGDATTVPPGGEATIEVEWKGLEPGHLVQHFPVYTDRPGQMVVDLSIAGDVVAAPQPAPTP